MNEHLESLFTLLRCHSTPGDEGEVSEFLISSWSEAGLNVEQYGRYAVSAGVGRVQPDKPTVLVCAHMDSPGYTVEQMTDGELTLIKLGSPCFEGESADAVLKTRQGKYPIVIHRDAGEERVEHFISCAGHSADYGDRVCFSADPVVDDAGILASPFLDNRVGCYVLCALAEDHECNAPLPVNLIIGATAYEEVGSWGAMVLATEVKPDFVICLDATYASPEQEVHIGRGPVLTLSDASIILSCAIRDKVREVFSNVGLPLQTEVYNYSGTDVKAFPLAGLSCPVIALLIATLENHSPIESASVDDIEMLKNAVKALVINAPIFI